jgi:hypothetical protein
VEIRSTHNAARQEEEWDAMEILQEILHDMQVAAGKQDSTASDRIYNRFFSQRDWCGVEILRGAHARHASASPDPNVSAEHI